MILIIHLGKINFKKISKNNEIILTLKIEKKILKKKYIF